MSRHSNKYEYWIFLHWHGKKLDFKTLKGGFANNSDKKLFMNMNHMNPAVPPALQAKMKTRQSGVSVVGGWSTNILPVDSH